MTYLIFNTINNFIEKKMSGVSEDTVILNLQDGQDYISIPDTDFHNPFTHVVDGEPIIIEISPNIQEEKEKKYSKIKYARDIALISENANYTTIGLTNNITVNARRTDLDNAKNLLDIMVITGASGIPFICFDNSIAYLTTNDLRQLILELQLYGAYIYQKKTTLDAQIDAATTTEEVQAIVW
jgi:hypothetical protein